MKTIILGILTLALAFPDAAQTAPATGPRAGHPPRQATGEPHREHQDHAKHMEEMHKHCQEMMKHHGEMDHGAKPGASHAPAAGGHAGRHADCLTGAP